MANIYVYSGAAGAATGADWTNARLTLAAACTASAAGDFIWAAHDHAETAGSANTQTSAGTLTNPVKVYCVNRAGSVPPVFADLRTTATCTTTGAFAITFGGCTYYYGISFVAGSGSSSASINAANSGGAYTMFESCKLTLGNTNTASRINVATSNAGYVRLLATTTKFGATNQSIQVRGRLVWEATASAVDAAGTIPTALLTGYNSGQSYARLEGVDLSAVGSGKSISTNAADGVCLLKDCKIDAAVTIATATSSGPGGGWTDYIRCASSGNIASGRVRYTGTQTTETTIVRTGGATDGTTPVSNKIVTTANTAPIDPFDALPIAIWNDVSGSAVTVTVYGIWGGGAVPNNDDIWFDLSYPGSSGDPQASFASCGKGALFANSGGYLNSNAALTTDSSTWGGSTTKFKMAVTVTPQQKGVMYVYVKAAAASTTFYIDPLPVLT